jgi:hypothetical protein
MEEERVADEVTELAANEEAGRQQDALAAALEAEEAARMQPTCVDVQAAAELLRQDRAEMAARQPPGPPRLRRQPTWRRQLSRLLTWWCSIQ